MLMDCWLADHGLMSADTLKFWDAGGMMTLLKTMFAKCKSLCSPDRNTEESRMTWSSSSLVPVPLRSLPQDWFETPPRRDMSSQHSGLDEGA